MKRCSSSISDTSSDTSSEPCSSDDDAAVDKKRKEEDEDLWHHLPFFWMEPAHQPDDEPMDFSSECGDSSDFDYDMYDEAADHATWVEWAQREKEKKEKVGVFFFNNNNMG